MKVKSESEVAQSCPTLSDLPGSSIHGIFQARVLEWGAIAFSISYHLYGTTFDICYNRYKTVEDPDGPARRQVRNDTLKWVLSEVLRDMRAQNRCYIKYEVKQGCFHMTVR